MKKIALVIMLNCLVFGASAQKKIINFITELQRISDIQALPGYLQGTTVQQVSSYDTTGLNDDGFSGKYSFIRKTADSALVIFEASGNGVINRIWTPTPTNDTLDFYFGNSRKLSFSIRFSDLFSGKVFPFVDPLSGNQIGGYYCYVPIPFNNSCKIVFRGKKLQFYQIQHRAYPKQYAVENFSPELTDDAQSALKNLAQNWKKINDFTSETAIHTDTTLIPGRTVTLAEVTQGGRITRIKLHPAKAFAGLNKQIDLKITWDDEAHPAIYMPVSDFFGYAFGNVSMQSLLLGTANDTNYCYFPMPFDHKAKVELVYRTPHAPAQSEPIQINAAIFVDDKKREPAMEGKFYAYWHPNPNALLGKPHVFLEGKGKGHYVGTILQAQGLNPGMTLFFEGDDSTYIDGEMRAHGTGSEDYFNGGWYALLDRWDRKMSLPLHGSLDYSLPFARTGGYRLFIGDKIPFEQEISHSIEHGPEHNNVPADYTSVAFYYADQAITQQQDIPNNVLTKVFVPDTFMIYPQLMRYSFAGNVTVDGSTIHSASGGMVRIDVSMLPKGHYQLYADIEKEPDGAEISVWQRQSPVSEPISFYAAEKTSKLNEYLCDIDITDFKETITLHFKKDETKSAIHINRLILVRNE